MMEFMNNFFLVFIAVLLIVSGTLLFFYNRDILSEEESLLLEDCVPMNLKVKDVSSTSFSVEWQTSNKCLGLVKYGDSIDAINYIGINEENYIAKTEHLIEVENLKPSSVYYFVVSSESTEYGLEGAPIVVNTRAF